MRQRSGWGDREQTCREGAQAEFPWIPLHWDRIITRVCIRNLGVKPNSAAKYCVTWVKSFTSTNVHLFHLSNKYGNNSQRLRLLSEIIIKSWHGDGAQSTLGCDYPNPQGMTEVSTCVIGEGWRNLSTLKCHWTGTLTISNLFLLQVPFWYPKSWDMLRFLSLAPKSENVVAALPTSNPKPPGTLDEACNEWWRWSGRAETDWRQTLTMQCHWSLVVRVSGI